MKKKPKKNILVVRWNWLFISLFIAILCVFCVSLALSLSSIWSIAIIVALIIFLIIYFAHNPAGRYFRLASLIFWAWCSTTFSSEYSLNLSLIFNIQNISQGDLLINKPGGLDWYIHIIFFTLVLVLLIMDYNSRGPKSVNELNNSVPTTKNNVTYKDNAIHNGDNNF